MKYLGSFRHRLVIYTALLILLGAVAPLVYAAGTTANLSWTLPVTYNDGTTALPATDIASITVCWTPPSSGGPQAGCVTKAGALTTTTIPVACGGESFTVAVTTTATAAYPNASSDPSASVPYATGVKCKPNPPTGLGVQ